MKKRKYHTVGTIPKSNWKIAETREKLLSLTQICTTPNY